MLDKFYKNRGFYNVDIKSTTAVITNDNQFELIFNINSGNKYYFNDVSILNNNEIPLESLDIFIKEFKNLKGKNIQKNS